MNDEILEELKSIANLLERLTASNEEIKDLMQKSWEASQTSGR